MPNSSVLLPRRKTMWYACATVPWVERLVEFVFLVSTHRRRVRVHFGADVTQADEGFGFAGVFEGHAGFGASFRGEKLVLGQLVETDELGRVEVLAVDLSAPLDAAQAIGPAAAA